MQVQGNFYPPELTGHEENILPSSQGNDHSISVAPNQSQQFLEKYYLAERIESLINAGNQLTGKAPLAEGEKASHHYLALAALAVPGENALKETGSSVAELKKKKDLLRETQQYVENEKTVLFEKPNLNSEEIHQQKEVISELYELKLTHPQKNSSPPSPVYSSFNFVDQKKEERLSQQKTQNTPPLLPPWRRGI